MSAVLRMVREDDERSLVVPLLVVSAETTRVQAWGLLRGCGARAASAIKDVGHIAAGLALHVIYRVPAPSGGRGEPVVISGRHLHLVR